MGRLLRQDFESQKRNIRWMLMITVIGAIIGFAFHSMYYCTGILFSAGVCLVYFNSFFDERFIKIFFEKIPESEDEDELILRALRRRLYTKTKYIEILLLVVISYIFLSMIYVIDAFDNGLFIDPSYSITSDLFKIASFPLLMIFIMTVMTPLLLRKKINKTGFVGLALLSIVLPYGLFLLDFLTGFLR